MQSFRRETAIDSEDGSAEVGVEEAEGLSAGRQSSDVM